MATTKISQLPAIHTITANTANTIFVAVDLLNGTTGKLSANVVADGLYSYNPLKVGTKPILLPNTIGQFSESSDLYVQVNLHNDDNDGTADYVVTANTGSDTQYYVDLGYTNDSYDNTNPNNSLGTSIEPLSGYLYVQGGEYATGNLVIGTTIGGTETRFIAGGVNSENVVSKITQSGLKFVNNKGIIFSDGTTLSSNVVITTIASDLATANAWLQANTGLALQTAKAYTDTANNYIQSHYLANTTGTFAGDLTITGNTNMQNTLHVHNSSMPGNTQYVIITGTANGAISTPSNPGYTIHTAVDTGNRIVSEAYGSGSTNYAAFIARRGRGTAQSPSAVQTGDIILRLGGNGYGATKFSQFSDARIEFVATQTHTDTSKGTQIQFWTTSSGSNTATQIGTMNGDSVSFTGTVQPQKGFIYTANVSGTVSAKTIDFSKDSLLKFDVNTDATITLSNYTYGKVVEVWITNSAAQNKIITHGCLANNSTVKSTTFTLLSGSCAYLRYFSIDGDNANTYVSIVA